MHTFLHSPRVMSSIRVIPLGEYRFRPLFDLRDPGAGQDVGRSCILVSIGGKNIMLDCGMHMGYNDDVGCHGDHLILFPAIPRGCF